MNDTPTSPATGAEPLRGRTVVLGVSGGIAAYKSVALLRLLTTAGAEVRVVMTESAQKFVGELTFQALSGRPVFTSLFDLSQESEIGHIQVADGADLVIVAPATANTIARAAAGLADDVLMAVLLATRAPVLLAPSMNVNMWNHPATRQNLERLVDRGVNVVGPGDGFLACRWTGPGRMAEPPDILEAAARLLTAQDLAEARITVTAGPTREPLDPVRFIGNRSTGRMGYAIARAAARRGADVHLISGPASLEPPVAPTLERVTTAEELNDATRRAAAESDAVIMVAAVGDFRPREVAGEKLKKAGAGDSLELNLVRNPDVLAGLGAWRREASRARPLLIGFAAETEDLIANASAKLSAKNCDLIVANDVSAADAGFEVSTNRVHFVDAEGAEEVGLSSKDEIAHRLLDRLARMLVS